MRFYPEGTTIIALNLSRRNQCAYMHAYVVPVFDNHEGRPQRYEGGAYVAIHILFVLVACKVTHNY